MTHSQFLFTLPALAIMTILATPIASWATDPDQDQADSDRALVAASTAASNGEESGDDEDGYSSWVKNINTASTPADPSSARSPSATNDLSDAINSIPGLVVKAAQETVYDMANAAQKKARGLLSPVVDSVVNPLSEGAAACAAACAEDAEKFCLAAGTVAEILGNTAFAQGMSTLLGATADAASIVAGSAMTNIPSLVSELKDMAKATRHALDQNARNKELDQARSAAFDLQYQKDLEQRLAEELEQIQAAAAKKALAEGKGEQPNR